MRTYKPLLLLVVLGLVWSTPAAAQTTGSCELGSATTDLDINNVRARLFNMGGLFWKGAGNVYNIPKAPEGQPITPNAIFASGIWIGGLVNGQLRAAAADYARWEFWPGPLTEDGELPGDGNCSRYDRIWKVSRAEIQALDEGVPPTADIAEWPADLGAPFIDANGDGVYNVADGDRPDILGDQMAWWVMNDVGNTHGTTGTPAMGLEVQVSAFAFNLAGDLGNTTFYKYKLIYKGKAPMVDTWFGIWSDPDLGNATDDYVGSDTTLGLGFVYNADNDDEGSDGYGEAPPATGYDFFQGPLVDAPGQTWTDPDGTVHENKTRLKMTRFLYYNNDTSEFGNPRDLTSDWYNYLRGIWQDGSRMCFGGNGFNPNNCTQTANFMYPGDPVARAYWSEFNIDGNGTPNPPSDRRFLMSTGPFTMNPGDVQEIVYGIVTGFGADNLDSVAKMRDADALAQAAFDANFQLPSPPNAPRVSVTQLDGSVILKWTNLPTDNNYLESYQAENPLGSTYTFEGYRVYQFPTAAFNLSEAQQIAIFDVQNGVVEQNTLESLPNGLTFFGAPGLNDTGIQHSLKVDNLTNYTEYYFGVQAFAYDPETDVNKIFPSPMTTVTVVPSRVDARDGGTVLADAALAAVASAAEPDFSAERTAGKGGGIVSADVIDPAAVVDATYRVEFYEAELPAKTRTVKIEDLPEEANGPLAQQRPLPAAKVAATVTTYDIYRGSDKIFDGGTGPNGAITRTGKAAPQRRAVFTADGLSFNVQGPEPGPLDIEPGAGEWAFIEIVGPGGFDPCGPDATSTFGCAEVGGNWLYPSFNGTGQYVMYHQGAGPEDVIGNYAPNDFEIRFTETGSYAYHPFTTGNAIWVPFEVWDIGPVGAFGENDPSDDVRMIPNLFSDNAGECEFAYGELPSPFFASGTNGATDRVYAYYPTTTYEDFEAVVKPLVDADPNGCPNAFDATGGAVEDHIAFSLGRPIQRIIFDDATGDPNVRHPGDLGAGTIIRFLTTKPNLPGDVFTFSTEGFGAQRGVASVLENALEAITIVPNPYKGASTYEVSNLNDVVRITNLPSRATIRIFTLSGTLIKTIEKRSPETTFVNWDLQTDEALPIASGIYLIHVEVPGVGEKVLKFAVVKKRIQLDLL
ncbi:MAG: hypothetical protein KatS3mg043_0342 [Rhodothermaceae bacterium]|nr:MAG: hypothetical protein KatS3mg043_0342 [Rhodothermaceae bacterium]